MSFLVSIPCLLEKHVISEDLNLWISFAAIVGGVSLKQLICFSPNL